MKINRGFVKIFLAFFLIVAIISLIGIIFDFYYNWMGYILIGCLIFTGILIINKRMPKFGKLLMFIFLLGVISMIIIQNTNIDFSKSFFNKEKEEYLNVTNIISGDTFEAGENELWLACVIAPSPDEEGYEESKTFLEELILNKEIKIKRVNDKSPSLNGAVYLFLDIDGTEIFVNKEVVINGFGEYYEEDPKMFFVNH
jgi:hypothetical protein